MVPYIVKRKLIFGLGVIHIKLYYLNNKNLDVNRKVELNLLCRIYVFFTDTNYKTSILPSHVNPFPEYPILHSQIKLPTLFVHSPFTSQGLLKHSFTSTKYRK